MRELYPHQKDAINALSTGKILWGGVGSGKTLTALSYYLKEHSDKDIIVITTAKKRDSLDWQQEAASLAIGTRPTATIAGVLTVDSWNNIGNYVDRSDCFFVFDEQRAVGNGAWVKSFLKITKRNDWILLSATPGDTWLDYVPVFIANGLYRNVTEFKREHVIYEPYVKFPKVAGYKNVPLLQKYRNMLLVEMPFTKKAKHVVVDVQCEFDREALKRVAVDRWHIYEERPLKDVGEMFRVATRVVNSDPSRIVKIREIMEKHDKIIVFYNWDYELDILRTLGNDVAIAEWNGHKHQPIPSTDKWVYIVQYVSGAEGWNCVETDVIVHYSLTYSFKNFKQSQGRIDRLDTPFDVLYYYVCASNSFTCRAVGKSLGMKRNFNEREWVLENLADLGDLKDALDEN